MDFSDKVLEKALTIAQECQGHNHAFCTARCPMHTDAIGYVGLIKEGNIEQALLKIREKLFLPGTLGRICAHPCETECRRCKEYDQPISIAALKRYAADTADNENLWDLQKKPPTGKKAAIIGAGPAGAQSAIDLAKEGHSVTVFEKLHVYGGMMRVGIPAYRLPRNIIDFEYSYLEKLGVEFKMGVEIGKDVQFSDLVKEYDVVIVANGAHKGSQIPTKGDNCENITNAVDYLKKASLEQKTDLPCKNVLVIGGGDVAMDCARTSLRLGATTVNMVALEKQDALPASKHEQHGAKDEGIVIHAGFGVHEIFSKDGKVESVLIHECTSMFDANGNFNVQFNDKNTKKIDCDTIIFATGQVVEDISGGMLEQGRGGRYANNKDTLATSIENVFVAGDNAGGVIVIEAMALGRKAALSAIRYLQSKDLSEGRDFDEEWHYNSRLDIPLPDDTEDLPRLEPRQMDVQTRIKTFDECDYGFTKDEAIKEASRCFVCECKKCMIECLMLNDYTEYPGQLFKQFIKDKDMKPIIAYSCNMCDQCTIVCPEDYKFAELFGAMRKDMVKANGGKSPMKGHKAIYMHQLLGFSKIFTGKFKGGRK